MATISVKIDERLKEQSDRIIHNLGLTMSAAVNAFLVQVVRVKGIPFELKTGESQYMDEADRSFAQNFDKIEKEMADASNIIKFDNGSDAAGFLRKRIDAN